MPIVKTTEILAHAKKQNRGVPAFNVLNLEMTRAVIEAAEETNNPVIIQVTSGALKWAKFNYLMPIIFSAAKNSNAKIAIHLDHTTDLSLIKKAIDFGFSSVMFDGSHLTFEENIKISQEVIRMAHSQKVEVELEIGKIGGKEDGVKSDTADRMTLKVAHNFYKKTNSDLLAVAFGTSHGLYKGKVNLDLELIKKCSKEIEVFLVMHGSSGVSLEMINEAIKSGITKVNIGTDLLVANFTAIRKYLIEHSNEYNIRKINEAGIIAMKDRIKTYFNFFAS